MQLSERGVGPKGNESKMETSTEILTGLAAAALKKPGEVAFASGPLLIQREDTWKFANFFIAQEC